MSFAESLAEGLLGEGLIARYMMARGFNVLPAYQVEVKDDSHKGPRLYMCDRRQLVTPDLLLFNGAGKVYWVEAKTKTVFTWYRKTRTMQTGINQKHWEHYQHVADGTPWPVCLFFLHKPGGIAEGSREDGYPDGIPSPSGLYWQNLRHLQGRVDHMWAGNHKDPPMVYWREADLVRVCDYEDVAAVTGCHRAGGRVE